MGDAEGRTGPGQLSFGHLIIGMITNWYECEDEYEDYHDGNEDICEDYQCYMSRAFHCVALDTL